MTGTAKIGNDGGIRIQSDGAVVGGATAGLGNLISGNRYAVQLDNTATNALFQGNYIGTDRTGSAALGNANNGILDFGSNVTIGGTTAEKPSNVILRQC